MLKKVGGEGTYSKRFVPNECTTRIYLFAAISGGGHRFRKKISGGKIAVRPSNVRMGVATQIFVYGRIIVRRGEPLREASRLSSKRAFENEKSARERTANQPKRERDAHASSAHRTAPPGPPLWGTTTHAQKVGPGDLLYAFLTTPRTRLSPAPLRRVAWNGKQTLDPC